METRLAKYIDWMIISLIIIMLMASCAPKTGVQYNKKLQKQMEWTPKNWKVHKSLRGYEKHTTIVYSTAHI